MSKIATALKAKRLAWIAVALAIGFFALMQGEPSTASPQPDCGPSRQWSCSVPGCPSCPDVLFSGTICEKNQFEQQTGRECTPI